MGKAYALPDEMRSKLAKPLGRLYLPDEVEDAEFKQMVREASFVATVGDRVTDVLGSMGRVPDLQVVDGKEMRAARSPPVVRYARSIEVRNPAGTITEEAIAAIKDALRGKTPVRVLVEGEEDLLAMPVIALAPEGAVVFYGQPHVGMVAVKVGAKEKSRNWEILAEMGIPKFS